MFKKIKANIQPRRQRKWQIDGMCRMIENLINDAYEEMDKHIMTSADIKGHIRHLPIIGFEGGYSKDIYVKTTQCLLRMWQYSIDMGYINKDKPFMSFLEEDSGLNSFKEWSKASKKMQNIAIHLNEL